MTLAHAVTIADPKIPKKEHHPVDKTALLQYVPPTTTLSSILAVRRDDESADESQ